MARRPRSHSKREMHDVRAFEETRCLSKDAIARIIHRLHAKVRELAADPLLPCSSGRWLEIRDAFAFLVLLLSGLRRFEFCAAVCGDIDFATGKLWTVGKGNIRDFVPLSDQAILLLREWLRLKSLRGESTEHDQPLFCATGAQGGFLSFSALRLRWKQILHELDLPEHFGIHATRHAAGMLVFAQTGSIEKTARFLRHRDTATTAKHYLHIDADDLRRELSSIEMWKESTT